MNTAATAAAATRRTPIALHGIAKRSAREPRGDDPVCLEPQPEPLAILGLHRIEPGQLLHALEPVGDRVAVREDRGGGRVHVAVLQLDLVPQAVYRCLGGGFSDAHISWLSACLASRRTR